MHDDQFKYLFRELREQPPPRGFDACWLDAQKSAGARRPGIDWRWALGPSLAISAAAVVIAVVTALGPFRPQSTGLFSYLPFVLMWGSARTA